METGINLISWIIIWIAVLAFIILRDIRKNIPTVGLVIIFALNLTKEHLFGAFIHTLPWYQNSREYFTALGFVESTKALIAFGIGSLILAPFLGKIFHLHWLKSKRYIPNLKIPLVYIIVGYIFYFLLAPVLGGIPTIRTFVYSGWNLMIAGLCLIIWKDWCIRKKKMMIFWLFFAGLGPIFTTIGLGFLGYGVTALIAIVAFVACFYRPRWKVVLGLIIAVYLGLSLYVNYMELRTELRRKVRGREALSERIGTVSDIFNNFEFFNPHNRKHLVLIEVRLNLNYLIGASINYIQSGNQEFAKGETIKSFFLAFIPRIIWRDKPISLGGSAMVTKYTGILFERGTSVAPGLVMEFYINFGTIAVVIGFMILGAIIALMDRAAALCLESGNWYGFIFWFLIGITFLPTVTLAQIAMAAAAAVAFSILVNKYILPIFARQKRKK